MDSPNRRYEDRRRRRWRRAVFGETPPHEAGLVPRGRARLYCLFSVIRRAAQLRALRAGPPSEFGEDGYDYDDEKDHNAGLCVRGLVAVRVNPMPEGYEEFDWKNGGYSLLEKSQIIVYGAGITAD